MASPLPPSNIYTGMEFPQYVFREFPKEVTRADGSKVIVGNQREELEAMIVPAPPEAVSGAEQERDSLAQQLADERAQRLELEKRLAALEGKSGGGSVSGGDFLTPGVADATPPPKIDQATVNGPTGPVKK